MRVCGGMGSWSHRLSRNQLSSWPGWQRKILAKERLQRPRRREESSREQVEGGRNEYP